MVARSLLTVALLLLAAPLWAINTIAYTYAPGGTTTFVYKMNADATNNTQLTAGVNPGPVNYSWDGKLIAFLKVNTGGQVGVWTMNADGTNQVQISPNNDAGALEDTAPSIGPDDNTVYFAHIISTTGCTGNNPGTSGVVCSTICSWTISAAPYTNAGPTCTYFPATWFTNAPHIDPTGTELVFESNNYASGGITPFQLYTCAVSNCSATAATINLLSTLSQAADPHWSEDGDWIAMSGLQGPTTTSPLNVWKVHRDGTGLTQVTNWACPNEAGDPSFDPSGMIAYEFDGGYTSGPKTGQCAYQNDNSVTTTVYVHSASGEASTGELCNNVGCSPRFNPVTSGSNGGGNVIGIGVR